MWSNTLGILATIISMLYRLPQIYQIYQAKTGENISVSMILMQNISYTLWVVYSIGMNDMILLASSLIAMVQNWTIHGLILYYRRQNARLECDVKVLATNSTEPNITNTTNMNIVHTSIQSNQNNISVDGCTVDLFRIDMKNFDIDSSSSSLST